MATQPTLTLTLAVRLGNKAAWGSGSASLARIAGNSSPPVAKPTAGPAAQSSEELWPTLGGSHQSRGMMPTLHEGTAPEQAMPPQHSPEEQDRSNLMPQQGPSSEPESTAPRAVVPPLQGFAELAENSKRKESWSSTESSPRTPPLTPSGSPQHGCRT
jgi:hypothetical protein